ncbi:MAG: hypothetical protein R2864_03865 [Syntrophotaleaceae bacterium]
MPVGAAKRLLVVVLDDSSDRRLAAADLAFYPPVPQVAELDWSDFDGDCYAGWEWIPLRSGFDRKLPQPANQMPPLVTMAAILLVCSLALKALDCWRSRWRPS